MDLSVTGMSCDACARRIESVSGAQVNYATNRARVTFDPAASSLAALIEVITDTGYGAEARQRPEEALAVEERARATEVKDLIAFLLLGKLLEARAKGKTGEAIKNLIGAGATR